MLAFAHIEKCGGTTLIYALRGLFMFDHFDVIPRKKNSVLFTADDMLAVLRLRRTVKSVSGHWIRLSSNLESVVPDVQYVTLLREPISRYVSEFRHFGQYAGCADDFEGWLEFPDRFNLQTKAIAGCEDLELAKELLATRFAHVGLVDRYDDFMRGLAILLQVPPGVLHYRVKNAASQRPGAEGPIVDLDRYARQIHERNHLDLKLYRYAKETLIPSLQARLAERTSPVTSTPPAPRSEFAIRVRVALNRVYRNLIYKPRFGYWPAIHWHPHFGPGPNRCEQPCTDAS